MWRGYSSSILTWKYCVRCLVVYFGEFILAISACGDSGEGGGVVGFLMMGDAMICAVFGDLGSVMVVSAMIFSVFVAGVSFSGVVGCRHAGGGGLVVRGGSHLAAVGWRGHLPAEGQAASCFQPSSCRLVASCERSVWPEHDPFGQPSSREDDQQTCTHSGPWVVLQE